MIVCGYLCVCVGQQLFMFICECLHGRVFVCLFVYLYVNVMSVSVYLYICVCVRV